MQPTTWLRLGTALLNCCWRCRCPITQWHQYESSDNSCANGSYANGDLNRVCFCPCIRCVDWRSFTYSLSIKQDNRSGVQLCFKGLYRPHKASREKNVCCQTILSSYKRRLSFWNTLKPIEDFSQCLPFFWCKWRWKRHFRVKGSLPIINNCSAGFEDFRNIIF